MRSALGISVWVLVLAAFAPPSAARAQQVEPYTPPASQQPAPAAQPAPPAGYGTTLIVTPSALPPGQQQVAPAGTQVQRVPVEHEESIRALWLPGLIVLPAAWVVTWSVSSNLFLETDAATFAWIPIVGPWLMLTQDLHGNEAGVVVSGVLQGLATLAIVLGLSIRRTYTEYEYVLQPAPGARLRFDAIGLAGGGMIGAQLEM